MKRFVTIIAATVAVASCSVAHAYTPLQTELVMQQQACAAANQRYDAAFRARDGGMPLDQALMAATASPIFQSFLRLIYSRPDLNRVQFEREEFYRCMSQPTY